MTAALGGVSSGFSGELPSWVLPAMVQWPAGQAVLGGLAGISMLRPTPKQGQLWLMAVARGAVQGSAALEPGSGTEKNSEFNSISELDRVLLLVQKAMGTPDPPKVTAATQWLRGKGANKAANTLGKLSQLRNLKAHSAAEKVMAVVHSLMAAVAGSDLPPFDTGSIEKVRGKPWPKCIP